jgi:hypothetical protein
MANALLRNLRSIVNAALAPLGVKLTRTGGHDWSDIANFIPFEDTIRAAQAAGMSVGDYVDAVLNGVPGSSRSTIEKMSSLGVFSQPLRTVVEIGPGTGRYLEKTLALSHPQRYEIYETAGPWSAYLTRTYPVTLQRTDGFSMSETAAGSAELVHAHKVFSGVPFMVTCNYWQEMARVIAPGGWAVFDIVTERCMGVAAMEAWIKSGIRNGSYPALIPRELAVGFFESRGFALAGSFIVPMAPGTTELMAFRRAH